MKNTMESNLVITGDNKVSTRRLAVTRSTIARLLILTINAIAKVHQVPIFVTGFPTSGMADFMKGIGDRFGMGASRYAPEFRKMNKCFGLLAIMVTLLAIPAMA